MPSLPAARGAAMPEILDNASRAERAKDVLRLYGAVFQTAPRFIENRELRSHVVGELVADILHLVGEKEFEEALETGVRRYCDEAAEQAGVEVDIEPDG